MELVGFGSFARLKRKQTSGIEEARSFARDDQLVQRKLEHLQETWFPILRTKSNQEKSVYEEIGCKSKEEMHDMLQPVIDMWRDLPNMQSTRGKMKQVKAAYCLVAALVRSSTGMDASNTKLTACKKQFQN